MKMHISSGTVGFGLSALFCVLAASCGGARGGSDDDDNDTGGSPAKGGSSSTGGSNSTGGTTSTGGTGGTDECPADPMPQTCSGSPVNMHMPADNLLINWETYVVASGAWGNMAVGDLTGGTSKYNGRMVTQPTVALDADHNLHITATIPPFGSADAENYAGLVFWFGPCVDASTFGGVSFDIGGALNGGLLRLQVQTSENYPADPQNSKGECVYMNCDNRWAECKGPDTVVTVPATPSEVSLTWSAFAGGSPNASVNAAGLVGLQFQLECPAMTECAVDITLGDIRLIAM
jgi:hypothetical protein